MIFEARSYFRQSLPRHSSIVFHQALSLAGFGALRAGLDEAQELVEHLGHVADDRHVDLHALGDRRGVDVDVDDLARVLREVRRIADHAIVEARADGQQHVAVLHRHVGFERAVHAEHAEELLVRGRIGAKAHEGVGDRITQVPHELGELLRSVRQHHAAARVDHRPLCVEQQLDRFLDLAAMALDHRVVGAHRHGVGIDETGRVRGDVLGDVDQHRPGPPGGGEVERLLDRQREIGHVLDEEVVLHAGARNAHRVDLLERIQPDGVRRHLAGEDHHRDRIHVRRGDAGHRVGEAGPGGDQAHPDLVARARIAVGGMRRPLLVAHEHVLHLVLLEELVVDVEHRPAGIAENILDPLLLQAANDDLCAGELHAFDSVHGALNKLRKTLNVNQMLRCGQGAAQGQSGATPHLVPSPRSPCDIPD